MVNEQLDWTHQWIKCVTSFLHTRARTHAHEAASSHRTHGCVGPLQSVLTLQLVGKPRDTARITFQWWHADAALGSMTLQTSHYSPVGLISMKVPSVFACVYQFQRQTLLHFIIRCNHLSLWMKEEHLDGILENLLARYVLHNAVCITHEVELRYSGLRGKCFLTPQSPPRSDAVTNVMFFAAVFH
jgi:hypothetical protein